MGQEHFFSIIPLAICTKFQQNWFGKSKSKIDFKILPIKTDKLTKLNKSMQIEKVLLGKYVFKRVRACCKFVKHCSKH